VGLSRFGKKHFECLRLVAEGKTSKVIAKELALSPATVDSYMREAITHFGVENRLQAAHAAARTGLIVLPSTLRPQPQPVVPAVDPAMLNPSYEPASTGQGGGAVRELLVQYSVDPAPSIPITSGALEATTDAHSALHVLLRIAALTAALVVVLSAAEPVGHGFQTLAKLIIRIRADIFNLPTS